MPHPIELAVTIGNLQELRRVNLRVFDSFYLGNPYCLKVRGNLLASATALAEAADLLTCASKKVYFTTPVAPSVADFSHITALLKLGVSLGIDGVEVHDVGVLRLATTYGLSIHVSNFGNVYNHLSALVFQSMGVRRVVPSQELTLGEIGRIKAGSTLELELPIHGKLPLGLASSCLLTKNGSPTEPQNHTNRCGHQACCESHVLEFDGLRILSKGTATFTGRNLSMIEHLPRLLGLGYRYFRIEGLWEDGDTVSRVGRAYARSLWELTKKKSPNLKDRVREIHKISPEVMNGWYFGRPGKEYVSAQET